MPMGGGNPRAWLGSRAYYAVSIAQFLDDSGPEIVGALTTCSSFAIEPTQRDAWIEQIDIMRPALAPYRDEGLIAFEYIVPRMGRRIDVLVVLRHVIFVIEFKVGEKRFSADATDQVWD